MSPIEEPKEPIFWLPFTREQIGKLEDILDDRGVHYAHDTGYDKILELAKTKLRCHDLLVSWPAPRTRVSRNLSLDELEIEL